MSASFRLPAQILALAGGGEPSLVTSGQSPAQVFRISGRRTLYCKTVDAALYGRTSYSVRREAQLIAWLQGKLNVPELLLYEPIGGREVMLISGLAGIPVVDLGDQPQRYIECLAEALRALWAVDISDCPFDSGLDVRLDELGYLLSHGLADVDTRNWEPTTRFDSPQRLYDWLLAHRPLERDVSFSHGDVGANVLVDGRDLGFIDLGRAGRADRWLDIAFCVREIRNRLDDGAVDAFFRLLGLRPDWERIEYYLLLDELF